METVKDWIRISASRLGSLSTTPQLDAEVLASFVLHENRAWILAHPEHELRTQNLERLSELLDRRLKGEPIAYITKRVEFFGRDFFVDKRVLIPRPESETIIELALKHQQRIRTKNVPRILDIGCGSGALGISFHLEMKSSLLTLSDVSQDALDVARVNLGKHGSTAQLQKSDLCSELDGRFEIVLANLPYVPVGYVVNIPVHFEPDIALYAGSDGLDLYRRLFGEIGALKPQLIITESLIKQQSELILIAQHSGYVAIDQEDLITVFIPEVLLPKSPKV